MSEQNLRAVPIILRSLALAPGMLWLGLATVAAGFFFYEGMVDLWKAWQAPEYSHGPLIPIISGYLFLRHVKEVPPHVGQVTDRWPGVAVLISALLLGLLGNVAQIEKLVSLAIIVWTGGMILVSFGWARGKQFWPPVLHLAFMLPLPFSLYWQVSILLQGISSVLGVMIIQAMNIPVFLSGHIIDLGEFKLHVAEACSGLRYLFPIMSFTYLFAVLYQGLVWHKAILLLSAIPIAVIMNSIRIGVVGVMVDARGIEAAEGFMHLFEGWVIFILCIAVMLGLARMLQFIAGDHRSMAEALDLDFSGLGAECARVGHVQPSMALMGTTAAFALAAFLWNPLTKPVPQTIERDPFLLYPRSLGEWQGVRHPDLPKDITRILGADDYLTMDFTSPAMAAPVDLFIAWYKDLTQAGIHSPEVCIPAGGWEMSEIEQRDVVIEVQGQSMSVPVNRAIIQKGLNRQLVYYWFDQSGYRVTSDYAAKFYLIVESLRTGRTDGALMRVITEILPGESLETADARLRAMVGAVMPTLPKYIATDLERSL